MYRKGPDLGPRKLFFLIFHMSLCLPLNSIGETLKQARFWQEARPDIKCLRSRHGPQTREPE